MATGTYTTSTNTDPTKSTYGENSAGVGSLQAYLNSKGAGLTVDNKYGDLTKAAVDKYGLPTPPSTTVGSGNAGSTAGTDTTGNTTDTNTTTDTTSADQTKADTAQTDLTNEQDAWQTESTKVQQSVENIQNGTTPLTAGEQAQVDGLKQAFQQLIDEQKLTNIGASGTANIRGYQTGAAEYDPTFQVKTIGSIVTAGLNKVADLNMKMASAVASLTQSFKDNDINAVKSSWDMYSQASKERQNALQKTIDDAHAAIKEARDAQQKVTDSVNEVLKDAMKNGADKATIAAISDSKSVSEALANAGEYLQTATGDLGDYLQYKRDFKSKGLTPLDYGAWLDKKDQKEADLEARKSYNNAKASAQGKAAGTPSGLTEDENGNLVVSGDLSTLDISRLNLAATRATKTFRDTQAFKAATNAGFYIAKIKAATEGTGSIQDQEILDSISQFNTGGGRVTEAQIGLILKGKSLNDTVNAWGNKLKNGGVLSDAQRKQALDLASATADNFISNYEQKYSPLAENLQKQGIPKEFWGVPSPEELKGEISADPKTNIDKYVTTNPDKGETVAKLYELPGWDDAKVWEYLQQINVTGQ